MKTENKILLDKIIKNKCAKLGFESMEIQKEGPVVSILKEDWHLFIEFRNPLLPPLQLQCAITIEEDDIRLLCFPSPVIITDETMNEFIRFCNEANRELCGGMAWGRFWCDEENYDFAYEVILPEKVIEKDIEETARQLFDIPCAHYQDLHTPLIMLAGNRWESDMAICYLQELRENGYVDNADYDLW